MGVHLQPAWPQGSAMYQKLSIKVHPTPGIEDDGKRVVTRAVRLLLISKLGRGPGRGAKRAGPDDGKRALMRAVRCVVRALAPNGEGSGEGC